MMKATKMTLALASVGGALVMAAPVAFAYDASGTSLTGAASQQWQTGSGASGTTLDQNSNISTGQVQAESYYNNNVGYGGTTNSNTYVANDGTPTLSSSTSSTNNGGSSWTQAGDYSTSGSSLTQNQSQLITSGNNEGDGANGGIQTQRGIAGTVNVNQDWTLSGGLAGSHQSQNGQGSNQSVLNQSSNLQTGSTMANSYQFDLNNNSSKTSTNQYTGGQLTTSTNNSNSGSKSYTNASNYSNPTAGVSQDQSQIIGMDGNGASKQKQTSWAVAGSVTSDFWQSMGD